jgi:hypothetical protein
MHLKERAGTRVDEISEIVAADAWARDAAQSALKAREARCEGAA